MIVSSYHKWECNDCGGCCYIYAGDPYDSTYPGMKAVKCPWCGATACIDDGSSDAEDGKENLRRCVRADDGEKSLPEQPPPQVKNEEDK
jgi:hypothetical protein